MAQKQSYAWATRVDRSFIEATLAREWNRGQRFDARRVESGIRSARAFAENAAQRRKAKILTDWERLGKKVPTLVELFGGGLAKARADAAYAREVLFGAIGDRAIRHQLQRFASQSVREPRYCEIAGCENELPRTARSTRKRCDSCRAAGRRT